jgi:hypothetical protein
MIEPHAKAFAAAMAPQAAPVPLSAELEGAIRWLEILKYEGTYRENKYAVLLYNHFKAHKTQQSASEALIARLVGALEKVKELCTTPQKDSVTQISGIYITVEATLSKHNKEQNNG